jgi:glycosyltransferase involved in cell wall biosynthesis
MKTDDSNDIPTKELRVLNVSSYDLNSSKFNGYDWISALKLRGVQSALIVLHKQSLNPEVYELTNRNRIQKFLVKLINRINKKFSIYNGRVLGAKNLLTSKVYKKADIIHLHIILDGTLDAKTILKVCEEKKVIWTWHDPSPTTGHCVTPMDCFEWHKNCSSCPDLERPISVPSIRSLASVDQKLKMALAASVIHVSSNWMLDLVSSHPQFSSISLLKIPFGLDSKVFYPTTSNSLRKKLGISDSDFVIGFRQTSDVYKNMRFILRFLDTVEISHRLTVITIGEIGLLERFKKNSRFTFFEIPWTNTDEELRDYYNSLSVFISPSRFESFGFMPLESMACGTRVIGVAESSVAEICELKDFGWIVQDGDVDELSKLITEISSQDFTKLKQSEMVHFVQSKYDIDVFIDQLASVYQNMLGSQ